MSREGEVNAAFLAVPSHGKNFQASRRVPFYERLSFQSLPTRSFNSLESDSDSSRENDLGVRTRSRSSIARLLALRVIAEIRLHRSFSTPMTEKLPE